MERLFSRGFIVNRIVAAAVVSGVDRSSMFLFLFLLLFLSLSLSVFVFALTFRFTLRLCFRRLLFIGSFDVVVKDIAVLF